MSRRRFAALIVIILVLVFIFLEPNAPPLTPTLQSVAPRLTSTRHTPVDVTEIENPADRSDSGTNAPRLTDVVETRAASSWSMQIESGQLRRLPRTPCPTDRFLWVNTHTYGRHHNQLQEFINIAVWARSFNRTVVLGQFRAQKRWWEPEQFYNFSAVMSHYCVISASQFSERWKMFSRPTAWCMGQSTGSTPLKSVIRKCPLVPGIPPHYDTWKGDAISREFVSRALKDPNLRTATFLGISGQMGFFMRSGLEESAAAYGLLEPSIAVKLKIQSILNNHPPLQKGYFGVHLRQRELMCFDEMDHSFGNAVELTAVSAEARARVRRQCRMSLLELTSILRESTGTTSYPLFVASDKQNPELDKALKDSGATFAPDDGTLLSLAVDFFMLGHINAKYFAGNQLSSISQNVCFRRFGRGMSCNNYLEVFGRYHARCLDPNTFTPNLIS